MTDEKETPQFQHRERLGTFPHPHGVAHERHATLKVISDLSRRQMLPFVIIAASDYDPEVHELYIEPPTAA